jgi:hypothetical protein
LPEAAEEELQITQVTGKTVPAVAVAATEKNEQRMIVFQSLQKMEQHQLQFQQQIIQ